MLRISSSVILQKEARSARRGSAGYSHAADRSAPSERILSTATLGMGEAHLGPLMRSTVPIWPRCLRNATSGERTCEAVPKGHLPPALGSSWLLWSCSDGWLALGRNLHVQCTIHWSNTSWKKICRSADHNVMLVLVLLHLT